MFKFSEHSTSWKIILEQMTGNVVISEDNALNVALRKAKNTEKLILKINWCHRMLDANDVSHKPRSLHAGLTV
jgi:hypothetical protein